ncbi:MAG: glycosyltransferase family 39 protein, partial [Chloroflexota bacterium]
WSLVLALGVRGGGTPWMVNALIASLTVALTYRLGGQVFSRDVGLIATWLVTFSPMALLLNATLMNHTLALFLVTLFIYSYWSAVTGEQPIIWGAVAGMALGWLVGTRTLTAVAVAVPFVLDAVVRLMYSLFRGRFLQTLRPMITLGGMALLLAMMVPLYRYATTGDPTQNLYVLVWDYDRVGFGPDIGRFGHTLTDGIETARKDLTLTAVDLFGWQLERLTDGQTEQLQAATGTYPGRGWSLILLPLGLVLGLAGRKRRWVMLIGAIPLAIVGAYLAYWIGSQRYSTRYYFEALTAAAILTALPLGWLAKRWGSRIVVWAMLMSMTTWTFSNYTQPRLALLNGFNRVNQAMIAEVHNRRETDNPVLVVITGEYMTWRAAGSLLAETGPFLDTDIILARNHTTEDHLSAILQQFPDREVIPMYGDESWAWFTEELPDS